MVGLSNAQLLDMSQISDKYMVENKINKIRVEGTHHMDERSVLGRVGIRTGQSFSPASLSEKVQNSVSTLYASGLFDDVTAWVDYVGDDGSYVDLVFKVKELPALDTAILDGCDEVSEDDLRLKIHMIPGQVYSKAQLERTRQAMLDHYRSEGFLLAEVNLSRGTGLKGLSGIKFRQGDIIRPLLQFTRKEILEYIEEQHLTYVDDSTNFENVYLRNKFRNQVIPLLEEINPSFRQNMMHTMAHLREAEQFVSHQLSSVTKRSLKNGGWTISKEEVFSSPDSHFILFETLNPLGFSNDVVNDLIHLGMNGTGKHFFSDQYELRCERKEWEIVPIQKKRESIYEIKGIEDVQNLPIRIKISLVPTEKITFQRNNRTCYVDFDKIAFPLTLRNCKSGDYFYPFGMKGRKKTSDFFIDNHYSQSKKENTWVLTTSNDEIIWIIGERADNRFKIEESSRQAYLFRLE